LTSKDIWGGYKVRWGIDRDKYSIKPGIYGVGQPTENSDVLVTANYKFTFDKLRKELSGLNLWILVLDTKGVNVWCAAGKGTFGTDELIERINIVKLKDIVNHNKLILPQLGAPGVAAHTVKKETGFTINYGPVYAKDIKEYINNNYKKTEKMSDVVFTFKERVVLIPVEINYSKWMHLVLLVIVLK